MAKYDLKPGNKCPVCKSGRVYSKNTGLNLPPTGGDYEYVESSLYLYCDTCAKDFLSTYKKRYWIKQGRAEYFKP